MTKTTAAFIALDDLLPSPGNIRSKLTKIDELAVTMREHGLLSPLLVVPMPNGKFRIVAGHRRRAAAERLGWRGVPCMVRAGNRSSETALMVCENAQREELDPIDLAKALAALREDHTIGEVASMTGFSPAKIRARIALLDLPEEAQDMVSDDALTLAEAAELVRSMKSKPGAAATARLGTRRSTASHFNTRHPLAAHVEARCTHKDSARRIIGPGCGQCWEDTIRADALGNLDNVTPLPVAAKPVPAHDWDDASVLRAINGDVTGLTLTVGDREEIVRRLVKQGLSDAQIGLKAGCAGRTVERIRNRLGIEPAIAPSRPKTQRADQSA